ncbi:MAG: hypothetical protein ACKORL_08100, partial [Phycisphaerales bacterium]
MSRAPSLSSAVAAAAACAALSALLAAAPTDDPAAIDRRRRGHRHGVRLPARMPRAARPRVPRHAG